MNIHPGLVIWACEGTKRNHGQVEVVNERPELIAYFMDYIYSKKIDPTRLRGRVQCSLQRVETETKRWSELTGIPENQFIKPIIKRGKPGRGFETTSFFVRYSSKALQKEILREAIEAKLISKDTSLLPRSEQYK